MKPSRHWIPLLGILSLTALFLKLPEMPDFLGIFKCKTCTANDPYFLLVAAGYFAFLIALSLLFPTFPKRSVARGGTTWSVILALALTYLNFPNWCLACLVAHACHILMWVIWSINPPVITSRSARRKERLYLVLCAPISVVALFSCLNLTFMAYGFKVNHNPLVMGLQHGETIPPFTAQTLDGRSLADTDALQHSAIIINFIAPDCPYCKEQLPIIHQVAAQLTDKPYRFINISPALSPELVALSPNAEWVEDTGGLLRQAFKVSGYPTLFVIGNDSQVTHVIPGVPDQLEASLLTHLTSIKNDVAR